MGGVKCHTKMELHAVNEQSASASPKLARIRDALIAVVSTGALLFLLWGLATQLVDAVKTSEATDWPQADGLIITSALVKGCRGNAQFLPDVRYQYVVDGQTYTGRRIAHGVQACGSDSSAAIALRPYPEGRRVPVFYNPQAPGDVVLEVRRPGAVIWASAPLFMLMALVWGGLAFYFGRRVLRRAATAPQGRHPQ